MARAARWVGRCRPGEFRHVPTANQVATITAGTNVRAFTYQPSGQVSADVRDPTDTYTFAANDNGRNASAALNGSTAGAYLYNAFEQRVQKTVGTAVTQFVFDRFGHLLEQANGATGAAQQEYLWLDDVPVGLVDDSGASPALYFIHTDQLGSPQKITNGAGAIVWDGTFDPFGNALFVAGGGVWGTSVWGSFPWGADLSLSNLRFPGQYADAETALNQNWFREYDPTIGRYIQSDPIGLIAGLNTYAYVDGNPFIRMDKGGRNWLLCAARCISNADFLGVGGILGLTAAGGTFPKAAMGLSGGTLGGASSMTTIPSATAHALGGGTAASGFGSFLRRTGHVFSPAWIAYGDYLFAAEVYCMLKCIGSGCPD